MIEWIIPLLIAGIILGIFYFLEFSGLLRIFDKTGDILNYPMAFFTGVIASLSSCFAVVGSIVIAFAVTWKVDSKENQYFALLKPNLLFHTGRIVSFFILGGLLGLLGGELIISSHTAAAVNIFVSLIMLLLGLHIIGLIPSINAFGIKMPLILTNQMSSLKKSSRLLAPVTLGMLTFFLPCGFTQSMQIFSLGSGSFMKGGLYMALFALGTLPVLFIAGVTAMFAKQSYFVSLKRAGAILIIIFSFLMLTSGITLLNNKPVTKTNAIESITANEPVQVVTMHIKYRGFTPEVLKIKQGVKVRWEIYGDEVTGCTNAILFPYANIQVKIPRNEVTIVEFMPAKKGYLPFSCWMGMVRGVFLVE
ncbi:MAG: hypothetical protein A2015_11030 [Spirochaetes bacterium GWF1_31_7]|nr:MAG: hypothetical protein A2Y30_13165 [Spirochaetes bacterium GWE1_32_154]OHD48391.1 MAG: hypothetical protein A2015_11030 [Spirochaetes bacterium GWF1_31_7]OHD50484.1 MAG: hypothetical protein A2Y29_11210 [Spirochaetes bacterium GWE2_31_10]OHD82293.1 MAG: hypothetical protein A2355_00910 [Spirochaetes bacterium RIFOXYB1_FULL_32_8]HBD93243.1 hypothetical protein [Spirochaetia bacterium]